MESEFEASSRKERDDRLRLPALLKSVLPDVLNAGAYHAGLQVLAWQVKGAFDAEGAYVFSGLSASPPMLEAQAGVDPAPELVALLKDAAQREPTLDRFLWTESAAKDSPGEPVMLHSVMRASEELYPVLVLVKQRFSAEEKQVFADLVELVGPALGSVWSQECAMLEVRDAKRLVHDSKAERRAKSAFLSRMSHDLRTPLSSVLGFAQLLEMEQLTATQADFVNRILKGGRLLLGLINSVLELTTVDSGKITMQLQAVKLAPVIAKSVDAIRQAVKKKGLEVSVAVPGDLVALTDLGRFEQILANLFSNAVKFNTAGGFIKVSASQVDHHTVQVQVADSGPGIPKNQIPRLFEPFDRLHVGADVEGAGLGLAISRALATALGGSLNAESRMGRGSVFTLELPSGAMRPQQEAALDP